MSITEIDLENIPLVGQGPTLIRPTPREDNPRLCREVKFEPFQNWALVQAVDNATQVGMIMIPEAYGQTFRRGIVMCVGQGTVYSTGVFIACSFKVGDIVIYGKAAGLEVTLREGSFLLVRESECFGKIPE